MTHKNISDSQKLQLLLTLALKHLPSDKR